MNNNFKELIILQMCYNKEDKTFKVYKQDSKIRIYHERKEITFYIHDLIKNEVIERVKELNDIVTYKVK